jgi:anti-sigma regulatory factor (Ser/Thr protein kinase)
MQAATFGMNWFREVAQQNLNQSAIALDALLKVARKLAQEVGSQTSVIYDHSIALTEETITNTLDLGHN